MNERLTFPVAVHLFLSDGERLLFCRRQGTGYMDGYWSLPAGHVERGETLHAACVRETREEIGLTLAAEDLTFRFIQQKHDVDGQERVDVFFGATLPAGQAPQIHEPDKCDGLLWAQPRSAPPPLVPYIAAALKHLRGETLGIAYFGYDGGGS